MADTAESLSRLYEGCRSYRRFEQRGVPEEVLRELVETARKRSSGMNAQPLRYVVVSSKEALGKVLPCLRWAAKLPREIGTPTADEEPTATIVLLVPAKPSPIANIDTGIALDAMAICAWGHGVGSCIISNVDRKRLEEVVPVPQGFAIGPVLALGYPTHTSTVVAPDEEHGLSYYVDGERNYYVPKRPASEVISYL